LYSCRKSHVDKWESELSAGDQVLHGYYYEQVVSSSATREKYQSISAGKNVIYICSEMAATDTFVMEDSLHRRILK